MNLSTPTGFRDVLADEAAERERMTRAVQDLFAAQGYAPIETPTLEIMDVLRQGALASGRMPASPFKLFDAKGDLLALRPDVTLQVARMCATRYAETEGPLRFRYTQRVFREAEGEAQASARELTQVGIECIGVGGAEADREVLGLFIEAMDAIGVGPFTLAIASVSVLRSLLDASGAAGKWKESVLEAFHGSDFVELDRLVDEDAAPSGCDATVAAAIRRLPRIRGGKEAIDEVRAAVAAVGCDAGLDGLADLLDSVSGLSPNVRVLVDFSVMSSFDYYTDLVFEAYGEGLGAPLGSGGRYDHMLGIYGTERPAAGFAFYLEQALAVHRSAAHRPAAERRPLRIAVPKGSLNPDAVACLQAAGLDTAELDHPGRQLIIRAEGVEYIIVRPTDAPVFVALGAADCGICGKDSLLEAATESVELVDLRFGACRFIVAEPRGAEGAAQQRYRERGSLRVATKYPSIAAEHFARRGMQVEIVKLHGNIELAPLTGMAECIVDITATGTTLRENDLVVVDEVLASTARFFANPCSLRTDERVVRLARALHSHAETSAYEPIAGASA